MNGKIYFKRRPIHILLFVLNDIASQVLSTATAIAGRDSSRSLIFVELDGSPCSWTEQIFAAGEAERRWKISFQQFFVGSVTKKALQTHLYCE